MRELKKGTVLIVRAYAGLHVVTLAWDFVSEDSARKVDLLGFAIERTELKNGVAIEQYFIRGIKRFKDKDQGLSAGTPVPTSEHPIQSFQWGDYTADSGTTYRYRVVPAYGQPKLLRLDDDASTTVEITTEAEEGGAQGAAPRHDIYFNRGVAGSQAYARRFGKTKPDPTKPLSDQMAWLSRGLFEALTFYIGRAAGKDATDYGLRAMLYEFRYLPVGTAFRDAHRAGADVAIRYEAQSYKAENEAMIRSAGIKSICKPQESRTGIRHNKFIVLLHKQKPIAVWTGSTNISAGGIFGHSNVGHVIWDEAIAQRYLDFLLRLSEDDVARGPLVQENLGEQETPSIGVLPPASPHLILFSPRDSAKSETLEWYADLMASAKEVMCMTFAFNLDPIFEAVLEKKNSQTLNYAVFDKNLSSQITTKIDLERNTVIASGAKLKPGDLENFIGEHLTGFNKNQYIHDKFLLIDPLGEDPIVITGTANFSKSSQKANDENMVVIRRNTRVADIYFGEFMRIFDHLYARYIVGIMQQAHTNDPDAGFLKDNAQDWLSSHFKSGRKSLRRKYFLHA